MNSRRFGVTAGIRFGRTARTPPRRGRAPIVLVGTLLVAVLGISAFTIELLQGERARLEDALRDSRAKAMALLANHVEQSLLSAIRRPFNGLKNIPADAVDTARLQWLRSAFPEVQSVVFLDSRLHVRSSFPAPLHSDTERFDDWLTRRVVLRGLEQQVKDFGVPCFVSDLQGHASLFALQPISDVDAAQGWLLLRFDLELLQRRHVQQLLAEFGTTEGGTVALQDAQADWDDRALNWPLTRVLNGWLLAFRPDPSSFEAALRRADRPILGVAGAVLLTMVMATFAVSRELQRERAIVELRNRFVANVSHELKAPLALIRMYAETLHLQRIGDPERQRSYHAVILREAERLTRMIDNVLDFARLRQGDRLYHLTDVDLRSTVAAVLEDYAPRVQEQGLALESALPAAVACVAHDRHGVTQILLNLIDNACKYAAAGKRVVVRLAGDPDWVDLEVIDFGPGLAAAGDDPVAGGTPGASEAGGSGLGLALVKQIAAAHHARLILDTPEGHSGLRAVVSFPACKSPA